LFVHPRTTQFSNHLDVPNAPGNRDFSWVTLCFAVTLLLTVCIEAVQFAFSRTGQIADVRVSTFRLHTSSVVSHTARATKATVMKMKSISGFLVTVCLLSPMSSAKEFKLYYLGGQSNMDGYGYVKDLSGSDAEPVNGVMLFHGNQGPDAHAVDGRGLWTELKPGNGTGFRSDGIENTFSNRFGIELSFARRLRELDPTSNIAIVKYSRGGTSISANAPAAITFGCWEPDFHHDKPFGNINQYDHFLATLNNAFAVQDIDGDGEADKLVPQGIVWMQGESDASSQQVAEQYEANLKRLMDMVRAALRKDDLRVVIGRISDSGKDGYMNDKADGKVWEFGDIVRAAQANFAKTDENAAMVDSTDSYGYSDPWHYDSAGYLDLGRNFADAIFISGSNPE